MYKGTHVSNDNLSVCLIAIDFGISSPMTIGKNDISAKTVVNAINVESFSDVISKNTSNSSISLEKAGSPTQPKPSEASVIPSWQAER